MTAVGRTLQIGNTAVGGASPIEATPIGAIPQLAVAGAGASREITMTLAGGVTNGGRRDVLDAVCAAPTRALFTLNGSGGCVPIAAAELIPGVAGARAVRWIYLVHGHGGNMGINLVQQATTPANVYIVFMVYAQTADFDNFRARESAQYLDELAPGNAIPDANVLMMYGPHTSLAITPNGMIGVLPGNAPPAQPKAACCCFLTTAACDALGLPDDCFELTMLRAHRDTRLAHTPPGKALLAEYDTIAPAIVAVIDARPDADALYRRIFHGFMAPAAQLLARGEEERAEALYKRMVNALRRLG